MTGPQYTERFLTLLDKLKSEETRDPILCLLAVSGEGRRKEDLLFGIVKRYLELYRQKKDLTWPDTLLESESAIYLEHSNDSRVFELLLSSLENEEAPVRIRTIALCRLPFMGGKRGIEAVRHMREKEKRHFHLLMRHLGRTFLHRKSSRLHGIKYPEKTGFPPITIKVSVCRERKRGSPMNL